MTEGRNHSVVPVGMPPRFESERTLAASHPETNRTVATTLVDYSLSKNNLFVIVPESNTFLRLAYIGVLLLQSPLFDPMAFNGSSTLLQKCSLEKKPTPALDDRMEPIQNVTNHGERHHIF